MDAYVRRARGGHLRWAIARGSDPVCPTASYRIIYVCLLLYLVFFAFVFFITNLFLFR